MSVPGIVRLGRVPMMLQSWHLDFMHLLFPVMAGVVAILVTTPTITCNKKCMISRCQICNILCTRSSLKAPGTDITVRPFSYYCNSSNFIYLVKCKKCDSDNYIGETSATIRLRMNNHKKSIRDNNKGLLVARHFNKLNHSISDLECVMFKGDFSNNTDRLIEEQTLTCKLKTDTTHGLSHELDCHTPYTCFHK